jgi:hypothetical protein
VPRHSKMKTLEEVRRIKQEVEPRLIGNPNVIGVGVGHRSAEDGRTDIPTIIVYAKNKEEAERNLPSIIQGVPLEIVERSFIPHSV